MINDAFCPKCYGNHSNVINDSGIKYCNDHGADPPPHICTCANVLYINGMCKACVGTNSAAIAMFRKIQGRW